MIMENTLLRSSPCPECGADMLWTQNAWKSGETTNAAYRCPNGHTLDPSLTRQCPVCGSHDSVMLNDQEGRQQFQCARCAERFQMPR